MESYYDYAPTLALRKPLVLISFVNDLTRAVANSLASTTGLPLRLLDDIVEHEMGASSTALLGGGNLAEWRRVETAALARLVRSRPPAVIAIGEGALIDTTSLELVLTESDLVYLYLSFLEAQQRAIGQSVHRKATLFAELPSDGSSFEEELLEIFTRRRVAYEQAHLSVDVLGRTPIAVGAKVLDLVERGR